MNTAASRRGAPRARARGRGGLALGRRPVSESDRISIAERLEQFRAGPQQEMTFEAGLSNHDRAVVHELCKKMGFKSKSSGKGEQRCVSVFKMEGRQQKEHSLAASLPFSAEAHEAIDELFSRFPPTPDELAGKVEECPGTEVVTLNKKKGKQDMPADPADFCKPLMGQSEIAKQVAMLTTRLRNMPALRQISQERAKLPIAAQKNEITSAVEANQVLLIAGETGCGKTTQVPQFILDHMWSQEKSCKILCTQPRRISATSVAERIATERGESVGETVGYQIRLESKGGRHSSLMFCTNGVLLRKLVTTQAHQSQCKAGQGEYGTFDLDATHIIVDEIHERDRYADFMLIILRDLLPSRPDLRLIMMSATLDAELFSKYFDNCPVIRVPGLTHPVRSYYLEDVLAITELGKEHDSSTNTAEPTVGRKENFSLSSEDAVAMDEAISLAWLDDDFDMLMEMISENSSPELCNYQHSLTGATALMVATGKGRVDDVSLLLSLGADVSIVSQDGSTALDWAVRCEQLEVRDLLLKHSEKRKQPVSAAKEAELLEKYLSSIDQEEVDVALIERLLVRICTTTSLGTHPVENGAVLIFFPGWEDITRTKERLQASPLFGDKSKFLLLPLHSMIPSKEQRRVFQRPPQGVRKIVLATNIAETAITIDDIVFVIDSGRMKEKSYDAYGNVSTLQLAWVSKASARQREGRAGRCQPGVCYHLFSKVRAAALPDFQIPEIKRTPLEELCLQVKLMDPSCKIRDFLSKAVDPPIDIAIRNAILLLQDIGALTSDERLTELGKQLGSLPVHPLTSKMLLFAILLNCLDPALTIACAAGYREPFVLPMAPEQKRRAFAARRELAAPYGGYSDHLAVVAAYERWAEAKSIGEESSFCAQYFVSSGIMAMLAGMRRQLHRELAQKGFISTEQHPCSLNSRDPGILRAVLVSGLYPMVGNLLPALPNGQKAIVQTARVGKVRIHPHSSNFHLVHYNAQNNETSSRLLLVFDEITRGEAFVYIRNSTLVKPHPLLLLATEMVVAPLEPDGDGFDGGDELCDSEDEEDGVPAQSQQDYLMSTPDKVVAIVVDRWLKFEATAVEAAQLHCLRERLAAAIRFKIKYPRQILPPVLGASVYTVACLLSYDGSLDVPAPPSLRQPANTKVLSMPDLWLSKSNNARTADQINQHAWSRREQYTEGGHGKKSVSDDGLAPSSREIHKLSGSHYSNMKGNFNAHQGGVLHAGVHPKPIVRQHYVAVKDGRLSNQEQWSNHMSDSIPSHMTSSPYQYGGTMPNNKGIDRNKSFKRQRGISEG